MILILRFFNIRGELSVIRYYTRFLLDNVIYRVVTHYSGIHLNCLSLIDPRNIFFSHISPRGLSKPHYACGWSLEAKLHTILPFS